MMTRNVFLILCSSVVGAGCSHPIQKNGFGRDVLGVGWQCFATATELDPPGTIFRKGKNGETFGTADLSGQIKIKSGSVSMGAYTKTFDTNLGLVADLLKVTPSVSGNTSASLKKTYSVTATYDDASIETTFDTEADKAKNWFQSYRNKDPEYTYYLIREAIASKNLKYIVSSSLIADLGGEAKVGELFKVSTPKESPEVNRVESYQLEKTLDKALRVCFKAEKLTQVSAGIDGSAQYKLEKVTEPIEITTYKPLNSAK